MSAAVDKMEAAVKAHSTVDDSAIELLNKLSGMIRDVAGDTSKTLALADELDAKKQALADAVSANTPAGTNPPDNPPPATTTKKKK